MRLCSILISNPNPKGELMGRSSLCTPFHKFELYVLERFFNSLLCDFGYIVTSLERCSHTRIMKLYKKMFATIGMLNVLNPRICPKFSGARCLSGRTAAMWHHIRVLN